MAENSEKPQSLGPSYRESLYKRNNVAGSCAIGHIVRFDDSDKFFATRRSYECKVQFYSLYNVHVGSPLAAGEVLAAVGYVEVGDVASPHVESSMSTL